MQTAHKVTLLIIIEKLLKKFLYTCRYWSKPLSKGIVSKFWSGSGGKISIYSNCGSFINSSLFSLSRLNLFLPLLSCCDELIKLHRRPNARSSTEKFAICMMNKFAYLLLWCKWRTTDFILMPFTIIIRGRTMRISSLFPKK